MPCHVDTAGSEADPLCPQPPALLQGSGPGPDRDAATAGDDPVPRHPALLPGVEGPERPAHGSRTPWHPKPEGDLAVGRDPSARDASDLGVDTAEEPVVAHCRGGGGVGVGSGSGSLGAGLSGAPTPLSSEPVA